MVKLYQAQRAELMEVIPESAGIKTLVFKPERPLTFSPGQFVQILIPGKGEAPFSPVNAPRQIERIEFTIMKRGRLTGLIHQLKPGAIIGLRGPYGKGFPLERFSGKDLLLISGGIGIAGLKSLLLSLLENIEKYPRLILIYGAKKTSDLIYKNWLLEKAQANLVSLHLIVEQSNNGWQGKTGMVTDLLPELQLEIERTIAVACGPSAMMKALTQQLLSRGFNPSQIYLSMERKMSCGIGKCGHCRLGNFYICQEGPVFDYQMLINIPELWE